MSNEDWEETDCWEHEEQQEEILVVNDTIVEDHPRNSTPSKRRRVEEPQQIPAGTQIEQVLINQTAMMNKFFEQMGKVMEGKMSPSPEMAEFYKTQTETLKATREAGPSSKFNEDKLVLVEKDIQVRDDGKTVIDIDMRMMAAKFPNSPPDTWWSAQIPQVSKPRLAHSLHFGYITGSHVCRETIYKFHDRGEFLTLKNFSSNNSGIVCKVQKKVSLEDGTTGEFSGTSEKDWRDIASLAEAKEAVRNIQVLSMIIRSYDYGKGT